MQSALIEYQFFSTDLIEWISVSVSSFFLIFAAEFGDKSQLVCMTLAFRHKASPVFFGALLAFVFLNGLAVTFGSVIAAWIPDYVIATIVTLLFAVFGFHALLTEQDEDETVTQKNTHTVFFSTFILIAVAEFGDKTQLAVVALSSAAIPIAVWSGATLALASTTAIGVFAGRKILQKLSLQLLHRFSGIIFMLLAAYAGYNAYLKFPAKLWAYMTNTFN
jgi:putative Ca2+/H+ antiporter (TMEM165/GDT1 family)